MPARRAALGAPFVLRKSILPQCDGYGASGTITSGPKLVEGSGVLATCKTEEEARAVGLIWARAWVDSHG
ncbi:hypothetical protein [Paraburkholderia sp. DGU8]|uniref:hypothetical protein n=1 Tax=Paraburkholderia sp. DGU8 TaxID=3161997 RepID=UPI00346757EC